jgi:hypothetical protein
LRALSCGLVYEKCNQVKNNFIDIDVSIKKNKKIFFVFIFVVIVSINCLLIIFHYNLIVVLLYRGDCYVLVVYKCSVWYKRK